MALSKRSSAGERVLEGRHVIGLFFLMLLFSGVFFTLGYVMGHNQLEGQVRAETTHGSDAVATQKTEPSPRQGKSIVSTPGAADSSGEVNTAPPSSEWEFYRAGDKNSSNDHLKPAPAATAPSPAKTMATSAKAPSSPAARSTVAAPGIPRGSYLLQVAALRVESEAIAVANDLRKKKFPAFVQTPQGDRYYRVQVGPYADQKAMQNAKKGLETAGFKAIIKH
jgi:septal ring-binding cell division protein DamX